MSLEKYKLSDAMLKQYALAAASLRHKFQKQAMKEVDQDEYPNVDPLLEVGILAKIVR